MSQSPRSRQSILVVEDNELVSELIVERLHEVGFRTALATSGEQALEMVALMRPALIVLDVILDGMDGLEVCRRLRQNRFNGLATTANTPVLMLTARAELSDRIDGFNVGVDDYLTKPFDPDELCARIWAVLRRSQAKGQPVIKLGSLLIDPTQRLVRASGTTLELTPKEFDLLHILASHPGQVLERATLLERVWGQTYDGNTRTVDVHVQRLREKLAEQKGRGAAIETAWGVGYRMVI